MHDFAPFGYFLVFWRAASIRQASKTNLRSVREAFIWDRASMEQVRSVRARYVKREAREGDDGMGLKYPQKEIACDWGRGRCGLAFRSHVFWWNVTEKATFQIRFPEWKCVKTPFFLFPCSCDRTKTTPVPFSGVSKVVNDFAMKSKTSALHGIPRKRQTQELN